jgi:hypothetical protein
MRIGRAIIFPAILALSVAGTVISGSGIAMAAGAVPTVQVQKIAISSVPGVYYHD